MVSLEFLTPIKTSLVFIESIIKEVQSAQAKIYLNTMKGRLTMLMYLICDIQDLKAIKDNTFFVNNEVFCPREVLK